MFFHRNDQIKYVSVVKGTKDFRGKIVSEPTVTLEFRMNKKMHLDGNNEFKCWSEWFPAADRIVKESNIKNVADGFVLLSALTDKNSVVKHEFNWFLQSNRASLDKKEISSGWNRDDKYEIKVSYKGCEQVLNQPDSIMELAKYKTTYLGHRYDWGHDRAIDRWTERDLERVRDRDIIKIEIHSKIKKHFDSNEVIGEFRDGFLDIGFEDMSVKFLHDSTEWSFDDDNMM